jgi:serine protease Do
MTFWRTAVLTSAVVAAGTAGAASAPQAQGQAHVVPAQHSTVMDMLRNGSEIGVTIRDLSEENTKQAKPATRGGALITSVNEGGPAATAGIKQGDIITEFDGERIRGARQFARVVEETPAGRRVEAAVLRDGQRVTLTVQPREGRAGYRLLSDVGPRMRELERNFRFDIPVPPAPPAAPARPALPSRPVIPDIEQFQYFSRSANRLGITVDELSSQLAEYFGTKDGVLVTAVTDDSVAAKAGLKAGDVITSFNNEPVTSASELRRRIQRLDEGGEFTIGVVRDKKTLTMKGKLEPRPERVRTYIS